MEKQNLKDKLKAQQEQNEQYLRKQQDTIAKNKNDYDLQIVNNV